MSKRQRYPRSAASLFLISILIVACAGQPGLPAGGSLALAGYTDAGNEVTINLHLTRTTANTFQLVATFTPPQGYHLYSKDIPPGGVRGQGRPTLIELPAGSRMQPAGVLAESAAASPPGYNMDGPAVYPDGPVTLTLPVTLPQLSGWVDDRVSLTYMACTALICKAPTVGKLVSVRIPGAQALQP